MVRGDAPLTQLTRTAVALIGTRGASGYGPPPTSATTWAHAEVIVVGGGSVGVGESAHQAAPTGEGRTVLVVLPCGVDQIYPREQPVSTATS